MAVQAVCCWSARRETEWFMQAGGKIGEGESAANALLRELNEGIGLVLADDDVRHLGCHFAPAANEPGHIVEAEIFHVRTRHDPATNSEIEEAVRVDDLTATAMPLAPLTVMTSCRYPSRSDPAFAGMLADPAGEERHRAQERSASRCADRTRLSLKPLADKLMQAVSGNKGPAAPR